MNRFKSSPNQQWHLALILAGLELRAALKALQEIRAASPQAARVAP